MAKLRFGIPLPKTQTFFAGVFIFIIFSFFPAVASAARTIASNNWSGYVLEGGYYTAVRGTWTIPHTPGEPLSANAEWVGIGGQGTPDLIQAGTMGINMDGRTIYQAWFETLPKNSEPLPVRVSPGDTVSVSLREISLNLWQLAFKNITTGEDYAALIPYVSSHSSPEWI